MTRFASLALLAVAWVAAGGNCTPAPIPTGLDGSSGDGAVVQDGSTSQGMDAGMPDAGPPPDAGPLDPDAACASSTVQAEVQRLPVDIIWMVDNSASMQPAIDQVQAGLNDFAALIAARSLDYQVIMLSLRGMNPTVISGSTRYPVCIPPPLSGDTSCGDGPLFHQVSVDVRSTQPLEQFLGTLGQTSGYLVTDGRGSAPWRSLLRDTATKTIVVVSDDNARMVVRDSTGNFVAGPGGGRSGGDPVATADFFEMFPGGQNPFNSRTLPEGILMPSWGGLFDGYTFSALYGWGSDTDPTVRCTYSDGSHPPASGRTYTELVQRTGGVRAQICDGPSAWGPFFDAVATAVERTSRIDCSLPIPPPPAGTIFQRNRINVLLTDSTGSTRLGKVTDATACDTRGGWHYDNETSPTAVVLCPATCDAVQPTAGATKTVDVEFGCLTIPI